jgi:peptidoglycan hydrolase-like protein with peptidoglycan-binding domain
MSETEITRDDRGRQFSRPTGEVHTFRVRRSPARLLEVEDVRFHHDSAVLMPDTNVDTGVAETQAAHYEDGSLMNDVRRHNAAHYRSFAELPYEPPGSDTSTGVGGLGVLATAYRFASEHPDHRLLLAGHADTSGGVEYNFWLSELRALDVLYLLLGERQPWVEVCRQKTKIEDHQRIVKHFGRVFGWDCDPGEVDNVAGPRTTAGIRSFQRNYNERFQRSIAEDGIVGDDTWGAFFDAYMEELAIRLGTTRDGLPAIRQFQFVDHQQRWIACGEKHPIDQPSRGNYRSAQNRRVEILFFPTGRLPDLSCHGPTTPYCMKACRRADCNVYGTNRYVYTPIDPEFGEIGTGVGPYQDQFEIQECETDLQTLYDVPDAEYASEMESTALPTAPADAAADADGATPDPWAFLDPFADQYPDDVPPQQRGHDDGVRLI